VIKGLQDNRLFVADEMVTGIWNVRAVFRVDGQIDSCLMMKAITEYRFDDPLFYDEYFHARAKICKTCPRGDTFLLTVSGDKETIDERVMMMQSKGLFVKPLFKEGGDI
jgi:hypothetical protein